MMAAALTAAAMTLGELLGPAAALHSAIEVTDLVLDSRQVGEGAAFVAVPGGTDHGLRFAERALARGAAVVLYEPTAAFPDVPEPSVAVPDLKRRLGELAKAFFGRGRPPAAVAGVTGTNGKTTVAYLIAQATTRLGAPCGYIGTLGYGRPPALTGHELTTPDCLTMHREIAALATAHVAAEVSSHALVQERVAGLDVQTAVFTNLTRDHLDHHGDFASYGRAKTRLFTRPELRNAVINFDDPFATTLLNAVGGTVRVFGTTLHGADGAALVVRAESLGSAGVQLHIDGRHGRAEFRSRLIGGFNAENLSQALGALLAWDFPLGGACAALADCMPPKGRMEVFGGGSRAPFVVIDYAHTPDALERSLAVLEEIRIGDIWCVFGCGGDRDRGKRALMGAAAARAAQHVVLTDDNPRGEEPAAIIADIRQGLTGHPSVVVEHERATAIDYAIRRALPGDIVLVAGKGHETVQTIGAERRPFDDRDVVTAVLGGLS
jgi:UDP-N-acetylmuramoyl-L-alanyl-D-glutamate--2,6-diaminopimelate ligase